ncbi:hypothetical protein HNY73_005386 [Argiope bruennichi]|uniref:Uncharacterized protein n=1 Tax=Argiope bruennichi TaxID=94029 RepID=A0A8T0FGC6_ARGBR|nr:hypothetical protein HNY73_005386 [Argiope bruennichi]
MLTDNHNKTRRMAAALAFRDRYNTHKEDFLKSIVTADESWAHKPSTTMRCSGCARVVFLRSVLIHFSVISAMMYTVVVFLSSFLALTTASSGLKLVNRKRKLLC